MVTRLFLVVTVKPTQPPRQHHDHECCLVHGIIMAWPARAHVGRAGAALVLLLDGQELSQPFGCSWLRSSASSGQHSKRHTGHCELLPSQLRRQRPWKR